MKVAALLLAGGVGVASVHAQSAGTRIEMLPIPHALPTVFFAPDSLAGPMLKPLALPAAAEDSAVAEAAEPTGSINAAPATEAAAAEIAPNVVAQAEPQPESQDAPAAAEPSSSATTVVVIVENVESNQGTVNVAVCDTDFSPEGCPYHTAVPAAQGFVETQFQDVPPGVYAVVGYHDVNDNDEFDKFLGVPREPYALSGAAAEKLMPDFRDAVLNINQGENYVIIRMKRLGSG